MKEMGWKETKHQEEMLGDETRQGFSEGQQGTKVQGTLVGKGHGWT